jgi:prepilin-type N-terminal cleavage/methylation domain-containing protein
MKKNGFTFIELLVTITIIGIIFASGITAYTTISKNSRNARRSADLEAIRQALEMCRSIDGAYPDSIYADNKITCPVSFPAVVTLKSTQKDPKPCAAILPEGRYTYVKDASGYTLTADCYEGGPISVTNP